MRTPGLHHITAIAGEPVDNLAFYTEVLGLRLVKRTVNFDDPGSYHLYFGDEIGTPGTIITFFPWPAARRGRRGSGQVTAVSFAVPVESFEFWKARLGDNHVLVEEAAARFRDRVLRFTDPDGLLLELVGTTGIERTVRPENEISGEHAIRGFAGATLNVTRGAETENMLTEILGFEFVAEEDKRRRFRAGGKGSASWLDVLAAEGNRGSIAVGTVHHIAFRARDDEEQLRWREELVRRGFDVSPVMDRQYFHSIYFREPSGILFEIATDGPGFMVDEPVEMLGQALKLPPMYEPMRAEIERVLPPLEADVVS